MNEVSVKRPHQTHIAFNPHVRDQFCNIQFFEIPSLEGGNDAVGWVLDHNYFGALPRSLNTAGLRLRAGNIQVGDSEILADLFTEPRFNSWSVGEFHVLSPKIIPNGRRDNFEHSVHYSNLRSHVGKITKEISHTCRSRSGTRNLLKTIKQSLQRIENDLESVKSLPHNFPFRKKHLDTIAEALRKQERNITRGLPNTAEQEVLYKQVVGLQAKLSRTSSLKKDNGAFKRLPTRKRAAYMEVLTALYEVAPNPSLAHDYVNKILKRLGSNHESEVP